MAYCLDEATLIFGGWVEGELSKIEDKNPKAQAGKRNAKLQALLGDRKAKQFADPASLFSKPKEVTTDE